MREEETFESANLPALFTKALQNSKSWALLSAHNNNLNRSYGSSCQEQCRSKTSAQLITSKYMNYLYDVYCSHNFKLKPYIFLQFVYVFATETRAIKRTKLLEIELVFVRYKLIQDWFVT